VGNVVSRRYRYGSSFVDQASGIRFEGHHPYDRPDLWQIYLDGAEGVYRGWGFEETLRRRDLEAGKGVPLFFLAFNADNEPVAGVRFHGPLEGAHEAFLMREMAQSSEIDLIRNTIEAEIRYGTIETKGAWSKGGAVLGVQLVLPLTRCFMHAMNWLGSEYAVAAVSDRLLPVGPLTGGTVIGTTSVPFPDERYRTIAVQYRRVESYETSPPENQQALRIEGEQLSRGPAKVGVGTVHVDSAAMQSRRPLVLNVSRRSDREVLRVLREDGSLQLFDQLDAQRHELDEIKPTPTRALVDETPRWVYYPWRRAAVRLVGPRSFSALRSDRNHNKITREEQAKLRTLRVGVVGSSAGHSIAHLLAMEGLVGELRLADFDTVEMTNLNRIPGGVFDLGVNKAVVCARRIAEIDPYLRVWALTEGITRENLESFMDGLDLVVEECDSLDVKFLVREAARERGIPVVMETSDRGVLDVERFDLEPDRPIFHGLLGDMDSEKLEGLSLAEKGPYVLRMLGASDVSSRGAASLFELGFTITGWPQLASEVTLGAVTVATAVRRFALGGHLPSGRVRVDVEEALEGLKPVEIPPVIEDQLNIPPPEDPPTLSDDPIDLIVDAARRAPSGGNVQPWRFEADEEEIRFYLLPERSGVSMDIANRGSFVGVGAAIFNARVAASSLRKLGTVKLFPSGYHSDHVATFRLGTATDPAISALRESIETRVANRKMGRPSPIDDSTVAELVRGVEREGARLRFIADRDLIDELAGLLAECDRLRFIIPKVHGEMIGELRWPGRDSLEEGMDVRTLEMEPSSLGIMELLKRTDVMSHLVEWRAGHALGLRTRISVGSSSAMAIVTVPRADPVWYVRGGAAMEQFWLATENVGLAVQPVAPLFIYATAEKELIELGGERHLDEMYRLQMRFREILELEDGEAMVMVLRVLHASPPSVRSIRRPLSHVLTRDVASDSYAEHPTNGASVLSTNGANGHSTNGSNGHSANGAATTVGFPKE
jgi:molybdopterin/thiamine biosynthesis adenylyltransferase/nitroreductase